MDTLHTSANGGSFNQLHSCVFRCKEYADEVVRLKGSKKNYKTSRSNLNKESDNYQKSYDYYTRQINECDDFIKGNLEKLNGEVAKLPGFHFELSGNTGNSDGGSDSGGDSGADTGEDAFEAACQIYEDWADKNEVSPVIHRAFSDGHSCFEMNGTQFVIIYEGGDTYTVCTCEPACHWTDGKIDNAVPIPGGTLSGEQLNTADYSTGEAQYPNFEAIMVNYFSS